MKRNLAYLISLALAFNTVSSLANAATDDLEKTLQERLDYAYGPVWGTKDPAKFVEEFLTDDAVLTGADASTVWHGRTQNLQAIEALLKAFPAIKAKSMYVKALGRSSALQFVEFDLTAGDAAQTHSKAKSLYVWVKTSKGWRVTADHYSFIGFDLIR